MQQQSELKFGETHILHRVAGTREKRIMKLC